MTNEPNASQPIDMARELMALHLCHYPGIKSDLKKNEKKTSYRTPARTHLEEEFKCLERWGKDTGLYQYEENTPKHNFQTLPLVTKLSIIDTLEEMKVTLSVMRELVGDKTLFQAKRTYGGLLSQQVDALRCIIVDLALSVDPEYESNAREDDASPALKTLFRHCATDYTTVYKRINEGSSALEGRLPVGHIAGPRSDFIRWGRETGVLLDGKSSLEIKVVDSDKSESRSQIVNSLLSIESALGAMSGLLPEKRVSGKDLPAADADENSNSNLSLTERAKGLTEQIMVLHQCNESLAKATKALVGYSIGSNSSNAGAVDDTATDTRR